MVDPSSGPDLVADPLRVQAARRLLDDLRSAGSFQRVGSLAARLLGTGSATVSLLTDEEWVIGGYGPGTTAGPVPLAQSLATVVVQAGRVLVLPRATDDRRTCTLPVVSSGLVVSYLGVPLRASGGQLVGVLGVGDAVFRDWSPDDVDVLEQLAASAVSELELAAANAALSTSLTRMDLALTAGNVGAWDVDLRDGQVVMDQRCRDLLGLPDTAVAARSTVLDTVHPDDREMVGAALARAVEGGGRYRTEARTVRADGDVRWIASHGHVVFDPAGRPARVVGTVQDVTETRRQAAERIEALQRAAAIAEVAASLAGVVTVADLSDVALRGARVLGANSGAVAGFEPDGRLLLHLSRQLYDRVVDRLVDLPDDGVAIELDDRMPAQYTARTGEVVLLPDARSLVARFPALEQVVELTGVQAVAAMPLRVEGRRLGALTVTWAHEHEFAPDDVELLEALAAQLALTFSRLQADAARDAAVAEMVATTERLRMLAEAGRVLSGTLDIAEQIGQLAGLVVPSLGDWCWIVITDEQGRLHDLASAHRDPARAADLEAYVRSMVMVMTESAGARVVTRTGEPLVLPTITPEHIARALPDADARASFTGLGSASGTVVPLIARGDVLGALGLFNGAERGAHTAEELETAAEIGRRAGLSLHHARLFDRQRRLADALQRSMLTDPPEPDHCEIVVRYVPATSGAEIGGDWYDAFEQRDGATVLVIGDVVGHDSRAAAAMGQVRGLLRGIGFHSGGSPAEVLTGLDQAISGLALPTMATALVARVEQDEDDRRAGRTWLRWSSAGHPPPVHVSRTAEVSVLDDPAVELLLGVDPATPRRDSVAVLGCGDTVLLYTDGLVERRDRDLDAGTAELVRVLAELSDVPLTELCDRVLERMFLPDAEDDVALLAVRVHDQRRPRPSTAVSG